MQARLGRFYLGWRSFTSNPLAMLGLGIVLLLISAPLFTHLDGKSTVGKIGLIFFGGITLVAGVLLLLHGATPSVLKRLRRR